MFESLKRWWAEVTAPPKTIKEVVEDETPITDPKPVVEKPVVKKPFNFKAFVQSDLTFVLFLKAVYLCKVAVYAVFLDSTDIVACTCVCMA